MLPPIAGGDTGEFVLRIKGDSMKDAGILDGDHVTVRKQETARNGEIVVALVGEEATVKRYFKEKDHIRLQPENDAHEPIRTRDAQILGRVVGLCQAGDLMAATAVCEEQVQVRRERRPCLRPRGVTIGQLLTRTHNCDAQRLWRPTAPSAAARSRAPRPRGPLRDCNDAAAPDRANAPTIEVLVMQSRAERKPLEESPDTAERGGRESDPAKAAGKCHRKQPPKRERRTCRSRR